MPAKESKPNQIRCNTFLPADLVDRIDRYVGELTQTDPLGRTVTRADAIRVLLADALSRVAP